MATKTKVSDTDIIALVQDGRTQQEIADELGVTRVTVSRRISKIRKTDPDLVTQIQVDKFRGDEPDLLTRARAVYLYRLLNISPAELAALSPRQAAIIYGTLYDKDEKVQARKQIQEKLIDQVELDDNQKQMLKDLIEYRTKIALGQAREETSGDSEDNTLDLKKDVDYYEADISNPEPQSSESDV